MTVAAETAQQIRGWLFEGEADELARLATGKTVFEVGSYCGKSTVLMAQVANHVIAVDDFRGQKTTETPDDHGVTAEQNTPESLRNEFFDNLVKFKVRQKVTAVVGTLDEALLLVNLSKVGMVFYDADHSYESTFQGAMRIVQAGLPSTATIVFHDYSHGDPGVIGAVEEFARTTGRTFRTVNSLAIFEGVAETHKQARHRVMLMYPGSSFCYGSILGLVYAAQARHQVSMVNSGVGWDDFESCWVEVLNAAEQGLITHAAMLHADVCPQPRWLDILLEELDRYDADLVSVPVPIKDNRGLVSTGIGVASDPWHPFRRWTVKELLGKQFGKLERPFPETFTAADMGYEEPYFLLHNTGCWACDLRKPVFAKTDDDGAIAAHFNFPTKISKQHGKWVKDRESEDWYWSRRLHDLGAKTYVTRRVQLNHFGGQSWPNFVLWGNNENGDEATRKNWE